MVSYNNNKDMPMHDETYKKIAQDPRFQQLVRRRNRLAWTLSIAILALYFTFILVIAFAPELLGQPVVTGSITTLGIPAGILIILSAFVLTGIYVHRANQEFDQLNRSIVEEAAQ
ncbi:DUF485 domain-containing protein [Kistimonas scapharcae]|uniref:DUF485 domain-containing protein n=2 Tax=Kistimonas scapharcae TaxID=1036133 RepID=A0ABP8UXB6_9GAMM